MVGKSICICQNVLIATGISPFFYFFFFLELNLSHCAGCLKVLTRDLRRMVGGTQSKSGGKVT